MQQKITILYHLTSLYMSIKKILVNEARHKIKPARLDAGLSQDELAKNIGRNRDWIKFRETEGLGRNLYLDDLVKISEQTGKSVAWFFQPHFDDKSMDWKACEYDKIIGHVAKLCSVAVNKHHSEMTDIEKDRDFKRLGIEEPEFNALCRIWPSLKKKHKEILLKFLRRNKLSKIKRSKK